MTDTFPVPAADSRGVGERQAPAVEAASADRVVPPADAATPPMQRWRTSVGGGDQLVLYADERNPLALWLTVGHEHAVPIARVRLDQVQMQALAAAARLLSGAAHQDAEAIRRDERARLAQLIEQNHELLSSFPPDAAAAIDLVVFLLRLDNPVKAQQ